MELHLEIAIHRPFRVLREAMLAGPESWLPVEGANGELVGLQPGVEPAPARRGAVDVGTVRRWSRGVEVPVAWQSQDGPAGSAAFEGTLRIEPLVAGSSRLRLDGSCQLPVTWPPGRADMALVHRDAHAIARDFFDRAAALLDRWARTQVQSDHATGGPT